MVAATMVFTGCGGSQSSSGGSNAAEALSGKVSASGSTALLPLLKPAQEAFQEKMPRLRSMWPAAVPLPV